MCINTGGQQIGCMALRGLNYDVSVWSNTLVLYFCLSVLWNLIVYMFWFLIIKPTRCTDFSNLFLECNSACFGQFLCPSLGVFHCTHDNGICHTGLLTACEQEQDGRFFSQAVSKPVWHIPLPCVQWKTPDDGQRNCQKMQSCIPRINLRN